jgi:hypothetical protein
LRGDRWPVALGHGHESVAWLSLVDLTLAMGAGEERSREP